MRYDFLWFVLKPFSNIGVSLLKTREEYIFQKKAQQIGKKIIEKPIVQNGPFKGMAYLDFNKVDYTVFPKLIGSYEKELWPVFARIKSRNYLKILNIGCGEGYYAIGLAIQYPNATIDAYDTNPKARKLCRQMAKLNEVLDRIYIHAEISNKQLENLEGETETLILCDCEGFEKELFTINNVNNLINCDILIEIHDFLDIETSTYLKNLFKETHDIHSILSIDDVQKSLNYRFEATDELSLDDKRIIFSERRPTQMEWLFCTSKN
ncbi:MAG: methyltransferase [Cytophagales bacterium]|nr:methyltransferase [Cytophagales bacterium]